MSLRNNFEVVVGGSFDTDASNRSRDFVFVKLETHKQTLFEGEEETGVTGTGRELTKRVFNYSLHCTSLEEFL